MNAEKKAQMQKLRQNFELGAVVPAGAPSSSAYSEHFSREEMCRKLTGLLTDFPECALERSLSAFNTPQLYDFASSDSLIFISNMCSGY